MAETAVIEQAPETKTPKRATKAKAKPPKPARTTRPKDAPPKTISFFGRVAAIAKEDWGTRASLTLYRLEPIIDKLRGSERKLITKYEEPIDENRIKLDYGSGRYRLYLGFKEPGTKEGRELDSIEFDILDMNYPPKIPFGEWVDDSRNRKWAWAKPKDPDATQQQAAAGTGTVLETFRVFNEIQDSVAARNPAPAPPAPVNPVTQMVETIKAVRELTPAPVPTPPATENAVLNTVVTLFTRQLDAQAEEMKELRKELREQKQPAANGLGSMTEVFDGLGKLMPKIKEVFPGVGEAVADKITGRSRMAGWMEFVQPALPTFFEFLKPIGFALGQSLLSKGPAGQQPPPTQPGSIQQPAPPQVPAGQPQGQPQQIPPMIQFLNAITPGMIRHLNEWQKDQTQEAWSGKGFASAIDDLFGERWNGFDWLTEAKAAGSDQIILVYQQSPLWAKLSQIEPVFRQFVKDFLEWTRPVDLEGEDEVTDLTQVM